MSKHRPVVVITGASSGIGRATALRFAGRGARLVLASRSTAALERLAELCREAGGEAVAVTSDVTSPIDLERAARRAVAEFGRLDVWVNNASVSSFGRIDELPLEDVRRVIEVDQLGYVHGVRAALGQMRPAGRGVIVNVASIVGEVPQPYTAPYAMSKAAVRALSVSLRSELALAGEKRIRVATVLPPTIDTPFFQHAANHTGRRVIAMPPVYPADDVAKAIVSLAARPKDEFVVGRLGRTLVRQHRATPQAVEAQMAALTEAGQLSPTEHAPDSTGILYRPVHASKASVSGGWHGTRRRTVRGLLGWLAVAGAAVYVVAKVRKAG
ncbi:SDR family NAD(P)-dependent oxidoreductase [Herbiconiux sp. VKM Ac-1786]|uniref:SDR family oxidoreductase n=1 Tax=Herbiconiux sp. VKM Ac-1786 TaxID=2783824 RepID=UPI00188C3D3B|nr:SDR family oxidoreductase [Herbiconiux sp. VKM Ac-1786]MBF4573892.1 SDR family NAD(P)-dependent oxidoreductase [Herbiconiux sp. VKM Ac-1786]